MIQLVGYLCSIVPSTQPPDKLVSVTSIVTTISTIIQSAFLLAAWAQFIKFLGILRGPAVEILGNKPTITPDNPKRKLYDTRKTPHLYPMLTSPYLLTIPSREFAFFQ